MTVLLPTLGVAFAAFCVWLAVRIVNRRDRLGRRFWIGLAVSALLIGYPLCLGPACWISHRVKSKRFAAIVSFAYSPVFEFALDPDALIDERPIPTFLFKYIRLGARVGWQPYVAPDGNLAWGYCPG